MKNTKVQVQFFDGRTAEWKAVPTPLTIVTVDQARDYMKAQAEMCDHMVDFRIVEEVA